MTQEEKQLLLKDLCARLLYGVKFTLSGACIYTMKGIDLIVTDEGDWEYAVTAKGITPIEIKYIKPYLRPMSSMTEEEKDELYSNIEWCANIDENGNLIIDKHTGDKVYCSTITGYVAWLLVNHFDFNHLIEKGLALEAPEGMYK